MPSKSFRWTTLTCSWTDTDFVAEIPYPHYLPLPHLFAGLVVNWGANDIPSHLASEYLNSSPPAKRTYYATFISGETTPPTLVVLTIRDGEVIDEKTISLPSWVPSLPTWLAEPSRFLSEGVKLGPPPHGGDSLGGGKGWFANAFSCLTFATLEGVVTPIVWVVAFVVTENTIVTATNVRLLLCGIPMAPNKNPVFLWFKPTAELIDDTRTHITYPFARTTSGLFFPADSLEASSPSATQVIRTPQGSRRFFHVFVGWDGTSVTPIVERLDLWDILMSVCYTPSRLWGNFAPMLGNSVYIVSPYSGVYCYNPYGSTNFLLNSGEESLLIPTPYLVGGCMDDYNLYGGDYRATYIANLGAIRVLVPTVVAYTKAREASGLSFRRATIGSAIAEGFRLSTEAAEWRHFTKPTLQVWSQEDKGYVIWENQAFRVDFVNNVKSSDVSVGGATSALFLLHPCAPTFPTYLLGILPSYYGRIRNISLLGAGGSYYFYSQPSSSLLDVSVVRMSVPVCIPTTGRAVYGVYVPAVLLPTEDKTYERNLPAGVLFIVERKGDYTFPIEPISVTKMPTGEIAVEFEMPVTGESIRLAFAVHNPPFPSFPITRPSTTIIADSIQNEFGWECETAENVWTPFRGALQRKTPTDPPYKVRVKVFPENGDYLRVIAYKV